LHDVSPRSHPIRNSCFLLFPLLLPDCLTHSLASHTDVALM
jgi:hypothetical protein